MHTRTWHVTIHLSEADGRTHAHAVLATESTHEIAGRGTARCNPGDVDVPEIGDELAASRALSDLAHRLLDVAVGDIEATTGVPATLIG